MIESYRTVDLPLQGLMAQTEVKPRIWPAALIITAGVYCFGSLTYSHDAREGFLFFATIGLPGLALVFALAYVSFRAFVRVREGTPGRRTNTKAIVVALGIAVLLSGLGFWFSRPIVRFKDLVGQPAPASVRDVKWRRYTSFNDGSREALSFTIAASDFPGIIQALGVQPVPVDWKAREAQMREAGDDAEGFEDFLFSEDRLLRRSASDIYHRPVRAHFFSGPSLEMVTDEARERVWILFDRMTTRQQGHPQP